MSLSIKNIVVRLAILSQIWMMTTEHEWAVHNIIFQTFLSSFQGYYSVRCPVSKHIIISNTFSGGTEEFRLPQEDVDSQWIFFYAGPISQGPGQRYAVLQSNNKLPVQGIKPGYLDPKVVHLRFWLDFSCFTGDSQSHVACNYSHSFSQDETFIFFSFSI